MTDGSNAKMLILSDFLLSFQALNLIFFTKAVILDFVLVSVYYISSWEITFSEIMLN